ncbi:Xaa-Pro aminopeptidase [Methanosarcina thermophila]|jgi:Xaa-Pro aminopeptidase|uniref:Xaa-Pro aminopeptidase n=3 Tax=Methanosarcina thermophila TaxID=2210 RepID=A0A1I7AXA5_METTE|nr:Xaa-Pro peptidase family protein [Methanosarcina thermophila]ALK05016.1 MAG: Xaa-Pro dipeptidase [Methanosarcina sp. 795]AKB13750.1 Xaa-Pro aminopeptidase [Methanosarcina thermophila TM-1]AKB15610.1 Xaa-Pro aminopeptidase [Methanosarcina thermophila CHTI-55]NLU57823.1 aminopeptidase P family protein [Methanosarcina thermophila]SFT79552.1 Xaa-Pro aminopeptidase [Methanosarcina thermophila]
MTEPEFSIKNALEEARTDAYLMTGNLHNSDIYYVTHFLASDDFAYLQTESGEEILLISDMEKGRAEIESRVSVIKTLQDLGYREKMKEKKDSSIAYAACISELLAGERIKKAAVPYDFPTFYTNFLTEAGFTIVPIKSPFRKMRSLKKPEEVEAIKYAQMAGEKAMEAAIALIAGAEEREGLLYHNGEVLTGAKVLSVIDHTLLDYRCEAEETIVSCGKDTANPHGTTDGPLKANAPIILDIFPRSKKKRYFADMTRTVLYGEASEELKKMYETVLAAQKKAFEMVKPGVKVADVHNAVCDLFEEHGYDTYKSGSKVGFIHSTGHGVGLDIHELPSVGENEALLEAGNVITIEPGLYYPEIGGIRLEDMVLVTENGCQNLTGLEKRFVL